MAAMGRLGRSVACICYIGAWSLLAVPPIASSALATPSASTPLIAADPDPPLETVAWRNFRAAQGLDGGAVSDLAEDVQGRVWAATSMGAYVYDGRSWQRLGDSAALLPNRLLATERGLWIGGDSGLGLLQDGALKSIPLPGPIALGTVERGIQTLAVAPAGDAWVGVDGALYRCSPESCLEWPIARGLRAAVLLQQQQRLWLGTAYEGLFWIDIGAGDPAMAQLSPRALTKADGLPNNAVRSLYADTQQFWIGTGRGLLRMLPQPQTRFGHPEQYLFSAAILPIADPSGAKAAPGGPLWVALMERGLGRIEGDYWRRFGVYEGLPPDRVRSLLVDRLGQLWIGTDNNGVLRLDPDLIAVFDERRGLPQRAITGVGRARFPDTGQEQFWVATQGGMVRWSEGRWQQAPAPLNEAVVHSLASVADDLWLADDEGLLHWSEKGIRRLDSDAVGLNAGVVDHLLVDPHDGALWVGWGHGLARFDGRQALDVALDINDSGGIKVRQMEPLSGGRWLLVHGEGMAWFAQGKLQRQARPCREGGKLLAAKLVDDGYLLAMDAGLYLSDAQADDCRPLDADSAANYGPRTLIGPALASNAAGVEHPLYILDRSGLRRVRRSDPAQEIEQWGETDGLPATQLTGSAFIDPQARLWLPTVDGLAVLSPQSERPLHPAAQLQLLSATAGATAFTSGTTLSDQRNDVSFQFLLPELVREQRIRYCHQLRGPLPQARRCSADTQINYSRLPAGSYQFRVDAIDGFGRPAGELAVDFKILPAWWLRPWALLLATIALIALGAGAGWLRSRNLARVAEQLRLHVAQRTRDLAEANAQLQQAAWLDPLTGTGNRRAFYEQCLPALRQQQDLHAIALIDVDHFKQVNDRFGHAVGDQVLVTLAERLQAAAGAQARLFRWGGEEFLLVFAVPERATAAARVEQVRRSVAEQAIEVAVQQSGLIDQQLRLSCSIGWVSIPGGQALSSERLEHSLRQADRAVYAAKAAGRNCVVAAPEVA